MAYTSELTEDAIILSFNAWCSSTAKTCPSFYFWSIILQLEIDILIDVRAIRISDCHLYVDALLNIVPWFFPLDHTHARWIYVHIRDIVALHANHPDVYEHFLKGEFTALKTDRAFSAIAIDQAHEQNNDAVNGDGGAVGLTENPAALQR